MNKLAEIDAKLIDLTQDAYLWLFDRTGVYVATLSMILCMGANSSNLTAPGTLVSIALFGGSQIGPYVLQHKKLFTSFNATARYWRSSAFRIAGCVFIAGLAGGHLFNGKLSMALSDVVCLFVMAFCFSVQIREREPKEWFPRLVMVGSHA